MHEYRQLCRTFIKFTACISFTLFLSSCAVYTVQKKDLEHNLKVKSRFTHHDGPSLNQLVSLKKGKDNNSIDTLRCTTSSGLTKLKRFNHDSKITVVTTHNKSIKYYVKSLYIWRGEFLIGELATPALYGANYFPVKLSDISRIEVNGVRL